MNAIIRTATLDDIETLIRLRFDYLAADMGPLTEVQTAAIGRQLRRYLPASIVDDSFLAVLAERGDKVVSTAFLTVSEKPANPQFLNGLTGTVMNVFTYPGHRRRGYAAAVMRALIAAASERGLSSLNLYATGEGEPLYRELGFRASHYAAMELPLG